MGSSCTRLSLVMSSLSCHWGSLGELGTLNIDLLQDLS